MAHFIVLFNLHYDASYSKRYDALNDAIKNIAMGDVWKETTSSCVFQANTTAVSLDVRLCAVAGLDSKKDKIVVIDLDKREKSSTGISNSFLLTGNLGF